MKKSVSVLCLLFLALALTACSGGISSGADANDVASAAKQVKSGSQGIEVTFDSRFPPTTIYDTDELIALVNVKNKGAYDLGREECFIQITGFDPSIISGLADTRSCSDGLGDELEGKSIYNLQGTENQLEFRSGNIQLHDSITSYNPKLNVVACYHYQTNAAPQVCVDPQQYNVAEEQKICEPQNVGLGGGQGGPVGVSNVNLNMVGNKAIFDITIQNSGTGRVLNPNTADIRNCATSNFAYTDVDRVRYDVNLLGGSLISCSPNDGEVRLSNNQGKIICKFEVNSNTAIQTPLIIDLDYNYLQSYQKDINIVKTPQ